MLEILSFVKAESPIAGGTRVSGQDINTKTWRVAPTPGIVPEPLSNSLDLR